MNNIKVKVYQKVLKEICDKYEGAEDLINKTLDEVCSHKTLSTEEVIYFLVSILSLCLLVSFFAVK